MTRAVAFVVVLGLFSSGCGPTVDLTTGLTIEMPTTGWVDAGMVDGRNKLVPAVTFTVKNVSDQREAVATQRKAIIDELSSDLMRAPKTNLDALGQVAVDQLYSEFPDLTAEELAAVADAADGFWSTVH